MAIRDPLTGEDNMVGQLALRLEGRRRILFWGGMGSGKSTLAAALAHHLTRHGGCCQVLALDPGTPLFGVPGAVCRGWWEGDAFQWADCQALCTLDAARFRLPLILASRRLMDIAQRKDSGGALVIDPPGVVRGVGGAELLMALTTTLHADAVVMLIRQQEPLPLAEELASLPAEVFNFPASPKAKRPYRRERMEARTALWDRYLNASVTESLPLDRIHFLGTPPPRKKFSAWTGRQAALLDNRGHTLQFGEILELTDGILQLRLPPGPKKAPAAVLVRDAGRNGAGYLATIPQVQRTSDRNPIPPEMAEPAVGPDADSPPLFSRVGPAWATLVGGVFGDPLLHVRLRNLKRSFFFDLGYPSRLAARVAHQVGAVFLSHAHIDHVGGFLWFLRSRIGLFGPCRIFGPAEIITRIANFIDAITWDRIEENAPIFEVCEIEGARIKRARLQPGSATQKLPDLPVADGIVLEDSRFSVRAAVCDHNIPSVAYALTFSLDIGVRKDRLAAFGWTPGPWLGRLKQCIAADRLESAIDLPDGTTRSAGELADKLTIIRPGKKLAYAADMADTKQNRDKVVDLARSAHTLFCETAFAAADHEKAAATQHLTTRAAVAIARAAGVERLAPFHFSKRYEHDPGRIYDEIRAAAGSIKIIGGLR
jgi:ribonuclease Z